MIIFALAVILIAGWLMLNWYLNEKAPEEECTAVLTKKKTSTSMDANNAIHTDYILIFDIDGNVKRFNVRHKIYQQYRENQKGTLIYKRSRFVDFIVGDNML